MNEHFFLSIHAAKFNNRVSLSVWRTNLIDLRENDVFYLTHMRYEEQHQACLTGFIMLLLLLLFFFSHFFVF